MSDRKSGECKRFLIIAVAVGAAGVIIGGITIWNMASEILQP